MSTRYLLSSAAPLALGHTVRARTPGGARSPQGIVHTHRPHPNELRSTANATTLAIGAQQASSLLTSRRDANPQIPIAPRRC